MRNRRYLKQKPDYSLALCVFALVVFGLVMISSASAVLSYQQFGRDDYYLMRQVGAFVVGLLAWLVCQGIDYHFYRKVSHFLLLLTLLLLVLVFVPHIGQSFRGVSRWIGIGGAVFQPSEIAKLTLIIYLAAWFEGKKEEITQFQKGFLPFILLLAIFAFLLMKQPDLGSLVILAGVSFAVAFLAGMPVWHLLAGLAGGFLVLISLVKYAPYRMARVIAFLHPESDPLGIAYHIRNALIAIGSGGLFGRGFGQSYQKHLFLPEAHTDSIFAIIAEELGFLRVSLLLFAFGFIAYKGYQIALRAPDTFGRLLAGGITTWLVFQAFVNIAGLSGLLPFTGVPLPFISYGGTSLVVSLAAVGILLNVSKYRSR